VRACEPRATQPRQATAFATSRLHAVSVLLAEITLATWKLCWNFEYQKLWSIPSLTQRIFPSPSLPTISVGGLSYWNGKSKRTTSMIIGSVQPTHWLSAGWMNQRCAYCSYLEKCCSRLFCFVFVFVLFSFGIFFMFCLYFCVFACIFKILFLHVSTSTWRVGCFLYKAMLTFCVVTSKYLF